MTLGIVSQVASPAAIPETACIAHLLPCGSGIAVLTRRDRGQHYNRRNTTNVVKDDEAVVDSCKI